MIKNSNTRFILLIAFSLAILIITLYFGLSGKGFHFSNNVAWLKNEPGIRFGNYGIAYALIDNYQIKNAISATGHFSIETAFKPEDFDTAGFDLILSLHDGKDDSQLIVGQYRSHIIVMNGDDYSNKRKIKRISADIFSDPPKKLLLTITNGDEGTRLYADGMLIASRQDLNLRMPQGDNIRVTLGNSVYGKSSWRGEIYGLALYKGILDRETIEESFNSWPKDRIFPFQEDQNPFLFFTFDEGNGPEATDHVTGTQKLKMPPGFHVLKKRLIALSWSDFQASKGFFTDFIINLLGFIPLGFILCALFSGSGGIFQKKAILFSAVLCFSISLFIEIAQAWIPSRSSQGLDLILNTTGALIGTTICRYFKMLGVESIRRSSLY
ncbi:MAG: VanZ family protein [Deltaproteobacteria bacterium]|nr:VanZ family protein [Deltaproteobacteria bacterium]